MCGNMHAINIYSSNKDDIFSTFDDKNDNKGLIFVLMFT